MAKVRQRVRVPVTVHPIEGGHAIVIDPNPNPPGGTLHGDLAKMGIAFCDVSTPPMVIVDELEPDDSVQFRDAFVKLAPRIPASARETFDGAAVSKLVRDAGAIGVVLAPVYLRETQRAEPERRALSARDAVTRWFDAQKSMAAEDREAAEALVHRLLDLEGM